MPRYFKNHLSGITLFILLMVRWAFPVESLDISGVLLFVDTLFTINLFLVVVQIIHRLGGAVLSWAEFRGRHWLEDLCFSGLLGMGILAIILLCVGFAHLFTEKVVIALVLSLYFLVQFSPKLIRGRYQRTFSVLLERFLDFEVWQRIYMGLFGLLLVRGLIQTLAPPTSYDALMYHLEGVNIFFEHGAIVPVPGNFQVNFPFLFELLFSIGLAFGSMSFPAVLSLYTAVLFFGLVFGFAARFLEQEIAWHSVGIVMGTPIVGFWIAWPGVDFAWAAYLFASLYLVLIWMSEKTPKLLALAGVMSGLSISMKYLGLPWSFVIGVLVLWESRLENTNLHFIRNAALFGVVALLIGSPWYLKNWIWFGNPLFPFIWGSSKLVSSEAAALHEAYTASFGRTNNLLDIVVLPVKLYTQNENFSTIVGLEVPSILAPLGLVYLLKRRISVLNILILVSSGWFLFWTRSSLSRFSRSALPGDGLHGRHSFS